MIIIEIIRTVAAMQEYADDQRRQGKKIALVPTMGYLHEGHRSLMIEGRGLSDCLVVSIFVNPTQFGPNEDLAKYPKDFERDIAVTRSAEVDVVFAPDNQELYGAGYQTYVYLELLPQHLCGLSRPVHFRGVATIVTKLFNIVKPHYAIFGKKDYQQYLIIKCMAADLNFDIDIIGMPTVRESDGLAMSSRNKYLSSGERNQALSLFRSLTQAQNMVKQGVTNAAEIVLSAIAFIESQPDATIDYITIADPETLDALEIITEPALMAMAVKIGSTRLIDNTILIP